MQKIDLKKELGDLYRTPRGRIVEVDPPPLRYLMIDGRGDPNTSPDYARAVEALFSVSYTAKFMVKKEGGKVDYAVMPLEGLWWAKDLGAFEGGNREQWLWTMMILQPEFATDALIEEAMRRVAEKKGEEMTEGVRLETFSEGPCAQLLHVGPFTEEGPAIERLHQHIRERSGLRGKHHEIYLSDIRRAAPENWKTIIRQPME